MGSRLHLADLRAGEAAGLGVLAHHLFILWQVMTVDAIRGDYGYCCRRHPA
jgi:hypothetical protein